MFVKVRVECIASAAGHLKLSALGGKSNQDMMRNLVGELLSGPGLIRAIRNFCEL
jgi:hypothetical protein